MAKKYHKKKSPKQQYRYGEKLQREGAKELIGLGLDEIKDKTLQTARKTGKGAKATGKIIAGTYLKETAKNKPSPVKHKNWGQHEATRRKLAKQWRTKPGNVYFDKKERCWRKRKRGR